jgi:nucleoside-diphosphate-sugar epimerase
MRILLAGANGTLGTALVPRLVDAGHDVLGLTRSSVGAARLTAMGVQPVVADLLNVEELLTTLDGRTIEAVIHQATAISGVPLFHRDLYPTDALRERGTANLLRAAVAVGARRFVTQSFFLGYGYRDHGPRFLTEDHPFATPTGRRGFDRHMRSLRFNEEQVLAAPSLEGIALRYGMFYGPEPATRRLVELARRHRLPALRPCGTTSIIHINDAASATVAALERGRRGPYNIVDDEPVTFAAYVRALAAAVGAREPRTLPGHLLSVLPYPHALMVRTHIRLSNAKAVRELDWRPAFPSYREGLADLAAVSPRQAGG